MQKILLPLFLVFSSFIYAQNVGIGTSTPNAKLTIVDDSNQPLRIYEYNAVDGANIRGFRARGTVGSPTAVLSDDGLTRLSAFGHDGSAFVGAKGQIAITASEDWSGSASGTDITFFTTNNTTTGMTEKVRILNNGNVGIQTTTPDNTLTVAGTLGVMEIGSSTSRLKISSNGSGADFFQDDNSPIIFRTKTVVKGTTEKVRILDNGNVGIGNAGPSTKLQISNSTTYNPILNASAALLTDGNYGGGILMKDGTMYGGMYMFNSGADMRINMKSSSNSNTDIMTFLNSGRVGINNITPGFALEVSGGAFTGGATNFKYFTLNSTVLQGPSTLTPFVSIKANGAIWATQGFYASSDKRAKENIQSLSAASSMDLINKINPVNYTWIDKSKSGNAKETGFIAQEIEQLYPAAITKGTEVLPNIMELGKVLNQTATAFSICLIKDVELSVGGKVKIITPEGKEQKLLVTALNNGEVTLAKENATMLDENLFVYGTEVSDFRTVDYNQIFTLNVSATQELSKQLKAAQAEISQLKNENSALKSSNQEAMKIVKAQIEVINERLNVRSEK